MAIPLPSWQAKPPSALAYLRPPGGPNVNGAPGANGWYHIIGFTGWQITACDGGKDIEGVWRVQFFPGPVTITPGFAGQALAVQLLH